MSIALRNFHRVHTPIQRIQEDSTLRMLLVICGLIAVPSLVLIFFLSGWVQYVFAAIIGINVAVPVMAYFVSLNPPRPVAEDDFAFSREAGNAFDEVQPLLGGQVPAEEFSDHH